MITETIVLNFFIRTSFAAFDCDLKTVYNAFIHSLPYVLSTMSETRLTSAGQFLWQVTQFCYFLLIFTAQVAVFQTVFLYELILFFKLIHVLFFLIVFRIPDTIIPTKNPSIPPSAIVPANNSISSKRLFVRILEKASHTA